MKITPLNPTLDGQPQTVRIEGTPDEIHRILLLLSTKEHSGLG